MLCEKYYKNLAPIGTGEGDPSALEKYGLNFIKSEVEC